MKLSKLKTGLSFFNLSYRYVYKSISKVLINSNSLYKNLDSRISKSWVSGRTCFSKKGNYCYFRIPKAANSTIARTLAHYDPSIKYNSSKDAVGRLAKSKFKNDLFLLSANKIELNKIFTFTFVRNPYTRVLSAYLDKIASNKDFYNPIRLSIQHKSENGEVTFSSFISYLEEGGLYENPHWTPQVKLIPIPLSNLSFVGKVENLEVDLPEVINRLFGDGVYKDTKTREDSRRSSSSVVSDYYDDQLKERVYKLYEEDFKAFSYSKSNFD